MASLRLRNRGELPGTVLEFRVGRVRRSVGRSEVEHRVVGRLLAGSLSVRENVGEHGLGRSAGRGRIMGGWQDNEDEANRVRGSALVGSNERSRLSASAWILVSSRRQVDGSTAHVDSVAARVSRNQTSTGVVEVAIDRAKDGRRLYVNVGVAFAILPGLHQKVAQRLIQSRAR